MNDQPHSRAWAEIDAQALSHNIRILKNRTAGSATRIMAVVKADAYGHGLVHVVPLCAAQGITDFGVATPDEGRIVRGLAPDARIYLLTAATWFEADAIVSHRLVALVSDVETGCALSRVAAARQAKAEIHLDVDTGIGRAGVQPGEAVALFDALAALPSVHVSGIAMHFTRADEDADDTWEQHRLFLSVLESLGDRVDGLEVHASNSPATLVLGGDGLHSLVRPGLLIYGVEPQPGQFDGESFRQALHLRSRVLLCRDLPSGASISYGRTYRVPEGGGRYATVGIGYGDGLSRRHSNVGVVLLKGRRAPIRGRVCMDQIVVDVSDIPGVEVGDVATIIGADGAEWLKTGDVAEAIGATPHELSTSLLPRVPRILIDAGN